MTGIVDAQASRDFPRKQPVVMTKTDTQAASRVVEAAEANGPTLRQDQWDDTPCLRSVVPLVGHTGSDDLERSKWRS